MRRPHGFRHALALCAAVAVADGSVAETGQRVEAAPEAAGGTPDGGASGKSVAELGRRIDAALEATGRALDGETARIDELAGRHLDNTLPDGRPSLAQAAANIHLSAERIRELGSRKEKHRGHLEGVLAGLRPEIDELAKRLSSTAPPVGEPLPERRERILVQRSLSNLGFEPGRADGVFDERTRGAIRSWQSSQGGKATGWLTREQVGALVTEGNGEGPEDGGETGSGPPREPGPGLDLDRSEWVLVQRGLAHLGFDPGPADGIPGRKTRGAIRSWQSSRGDGATGFLTREQADALAGLGREEAERRRAEAERRAREAEERRRAELRRKPGYRFRDCGGCPEMVVIPAGDFMMGSPTSEEGRHYNEGPAHHVRIARPFAVGVYKVTRGEFARFIGATGHLMGDSCRTYEDGEWKERSGRDWRDPGYEQTDRHPVTCVSWADAQAYAGWLSDETGEGYRLLSESEWEYVARAGTVTARYWVGDERVQCRYANGGDEAFKRRQAGWKWRIASCDDGHAWTSPVGSYRGNDFGLRDVLGNVWEWVEDCWNGGYHGAPRDGRVRVSGDCGLRVFARRLLEQRSEGSPHRQPQQVLLRIP